MHAEPHPRQDERLKALYSYEILDTDREKDFDDVVKLTAALCEAPVSMISLVDDRRQWFKAETGLGERETPIGVSICAHAILDGDITEIPDTALDPRTADNPFCIGDDAVRFYAGAVLRTETGLPLGTLCVLDRRPRRLTRLQRDAIRVLARQVMAQLDLRRALELAATMRREIDHRVKNSLQSISSLARIEARATDNEEAARALLAMDARIDAVARVHEQLYRTDAGANVDLERYLATMVDGIRQIAPPNLAIEVDAAPVSVNSRQAAAIGMMVNEFAANSIKHGYPDGRPGRISIGLRHAEGGAIRFFCRDDGVGLHEAGSGGRGGLGMNIAEAVAMQLGCEIHVPDDEGGLTMEFVFVPETRAPPDADRIALAV